MTCDELFSVIAAAGYTLGNMFQTPYVQGSETCDNAWSAHFHDARGKWVKGFGRTPLQALSDVVQQLRVPIVKSTSLEDFI